jgi:hypothetical protein
MEAEVIRASNWRPRLSNTLQGFVDLALSPSGLGDKRWIGLPSKPQIDSEGRHRGDPTTGKKLCTPVVEILDKQRYALFQRAALEAVDRLLGKGAAP